MSRKPRIWTVSLHPDGICEWFVGEIWVELAGHQWREETVVDVDQENFDRRLEEEMQIVSRLFTNPTDDIRFFG